MFTKGRLSIFIFIIILSFGLDARTPVSRQATFLEVFHNGVVEVQAIGRYTSNLGSLSRRRDDIRRNGEQNALVDARLSAIYFLLNSGPAPLLRNDGDRTRFQERGLFVYDAHNITRYITFEDRRNISTVTTNNGQTISLVRTMRIDRERLFRELQNAMVIDSGVELRAIGQSAREEPGTRAIVPPIAVVEPRVTTQPILMTEPERVVDPPIVTEPPDRSIERAIARIAITGSSVERAVARSLRAMIKDLPLNTTIAVLSVSSNDPDLSASIIDEIMVRLFSIRNITGYSFADRQTLANVRSELNLRASGEVDDRSAVELGQLIGAEIVITGRITGERRDRRLTLTAINVQNAEIVSITRERVN